MPRNVFVLYNRVHPDGFKFIAHDGEHCLGVHLAEGVNFDRVNVTLVSELSQQQNFNPWWLHHQLMNNSDRTIIARNKRIEDAREHDPGQALWLGKRDQRNFRVKPKPGKRVARVTGQLRSNPMVIVGYSDATLPPTIHG